MPTITNYTTKCDLTIAGTATLPDLRGHDDPWMSRLDGYSSVAMMPRRRSALSGVQPAGCRTVAQPSTNSRW